MTRAWLLFFALLTVFLGGTLSSCAVFEAIGDSLSQFYDNSVSYFNAYYNAQQIFEEAELTVIQAQKDANAKAILSQKPPAPAPPPRDKFNSVIDKCSSILSFYPNSALVDDALLLIGKSYYYVQDYLKAERKFSELLAQYPNSPLALEGELWFAKTLERLRKEEEAKKVATQVAQDAVEEDESSIAAEAFSLLGSMAEQDNTTEQAIEYYSNALQHTGESYSVASAYAKIGDLYTALENFERANAAYIKVYEEGVADISLNYYGRIQAVRGYAALKRYDTAMFLAEEMLEDYRFAQFHTLIRLEYAGVLLASGYTEDAIDEYQFMDTTFVRTEHGANASYALAQYYEKQTGDYQRAASYYTRASSVQAAPVSQQSKKRENALLRVMAAYRELLKNDSLVALSDSARRYPENFLQLVPVDTVAALVADSSSVVSDSLTMSPPEPRYVATFTPLNPDSIQIVKARIAYDLGEIYYSEIEIPDSALVWFQKAWDWRGDSTRAPRTLFILAELKKALQRASDDDIAGVYRIIVEQYPWSSYANEARRILGLQTTERSDVENVREYAVAESLLWSGDNEAAIERLKAIVEENSTLPIAAKSQYALGWIYEHRLSKPDSAMIFYRAVAEQFKSSPYAAAVKNRIGGASEERKQEQSPQQAPPPDQQKVQPQPEPPPAVDDDIRPRRVPSGRQAKPDTLKPRKDR